MSEELCGQGSHESLAEECSSVPGRPAHGRNTLWNVSAFSRGSWQHEIRPTPPSPQCYSCSIASETRQPSHPLYPMLTYPAYRFPHPL
ncbi:hypothetical protein FKM82_016203 [Ascaphus truei]